MNNKTVMYEFLRKLKKDDILKLSLKTCGHGHNFLSHPQCFATSLKPNEKIGYLDIETSNLKGDFGQILSYCIKEDGGKIIKRVLTTNEIRSDIKDKDLVEELVTDMRKFDRIITYFGSRFDIPFIRTRAVYWNHEFPVCREIFHTDCFYIIKSKFNLHRKSLEVACEFFGIPAKDHKIKPTIWQDAMAGQKSALDYILQHNEEDVISLEALYKKVNVYTLVNNTSV